MSPELFELLKNRPAKFALDEVSFVLACIIAVLTPEQQDKLEKLFDEFDAQNQEDKK